MWVNTAFELPPVGQLCVGARSGEARVLVTWDSQFWVDSRTHQRYPQADVQYWFALPTPPME